MNKVIEMISCENIPQYTGLGNTTSIEIKEGCEWDGHAYAICIGIVYDDETVESYFKADQEKNNTEIFDMLRKDIRMIKKHEYLVNRETMEEKNGNRYFIPYKVKDHCSEKPTVTDSYVDGCSNVRYFIEYEIVLAAGDDYKRYITVDYETEGSYSTCFFDQVESIKEMFEEWFEEESHGFRITEDGYRTVTFYDETGESCQVEIFSMSKLMSMIASIRVIKCNRKIID